ncbi:MAG: 4Fe-4S binding protein [Eubacteriaceae bacterium]
MNKDIRLTVNKQRCPADHKCPAIGVCPVGAIKQEGHNAPTIDHEKCTKCGKCATFCPMKALNLE